MGRERSTSAASDAGDAAPRTGHTRLHQGLALVTLVGALASVGLGVLLAGSPPASIRSAAPSQAAVPDPAALAGQSTFRAAVPIESNVFATTVTTAPVAVIADPSAPAARLPVPPTPPVTIPVVGPVLGSVVDEVVDEVVAPVADTLGATVGDTVDTVDTVTGTVSETVVAPVVGLLDGLVGGLLGGGR